jgi:predicted Zn-ribbon and HTH transcriptional regulator
MPKKQRTIVDLSAKHFSRYGEFLASFELSKHGWDTYTPVYDEYIDLIIHKIVCKKCGQVWTTKLKLICKKCKKEITTSNKNKIIANGRCKNCGYLFLKKNRKTCPKCESDRLENIPTCPFCKKGKVEIEKIKCACGSRNFLEKIRTIQVKASRLERRGNSFAVDLKPRDLVQGENHFYIWICIDEDNKAYFLVIPIKEFKKKTKDFINSTSFLKDQGREHFSAITFGKWKKYLNRFDKLE